MIIMIKAPSSSIISSLISLPKEHFLTLLWPQFCWACMIIHICMYVHVGTVKDSPEPTRDRVYESIFMQKF